MSLVTRDTMECRGCLKKFKNKQAFDQHHEKGCIIANAICGLNQTMESREKAAAEFRKLMKIIDGYSKQVHELSDVVNNLQRQISGVTGKKRGHSKIMTDAEILNSNPCARPKVTLAALINAISASVAMDTGPKLNKYLRLVVDMSLADAMISLLRDTYDNMVSQEDACGKPIDNRNLWFPILHKLKKKTFLVFDRSEPLMEINAGVAPTAVSESADTDLHAEEEKNKWKIVNDSGLRVLVDQLHACLRNAYFRWRESNIELLDSVDSIAKEDLIMTLKIVQYGTQSDNTVTKVIRDWITMRTDRCVEFIEAKGNK